MAEEVKTERPPALHDRWTFSYAGPLNKPSEKQPPPDAWNSSFTDIYTVENVEELWGVLNNIRPPSQLDHGSDYHVFRDGIKPEWEDQHNVSGGKWIITITPANPPTWNVDELWLHTVLAMVGEAFLVHGEDVCGAVISLRPQRTKIALWTRTTEPTICQVIGNTWKEQIKSSGLKISFQPHLVKETVSKSIPTQHEV